MLFRSHLGVTEQAGVAVLMRRYRLQWLVAGLVVLAGLFVWKNSSSLVPAPASEQHDDDDVAGKDAAAGFVNLLRRSISSRDLLDVCFSEWKKSQPQSGRYSADRLAQAESIFQAESSLPSRERAPLQTYQRICAALAVRNHESTSPTSNPNHEH